MKSGFARPIGATIGARAAVLAVALAATAAVLFGLSQLALRDYLSRTDQLEQAVWRHGVDWPMNRPEMLVGGAPVAASAWRFDADRLSLTATGGSTFVSLNFAGRLLPATHLSRLELKIYSDRSTVLRWFHRSRLDGPIAASPPMRLTAGQHLLQIDLNNLKWALPDGTEVPWGQREAAVATLRLHPAAAGKAQLAMERISLLPAPPVVPRSAVSTTPEALGRLAPTGSSRFLLASSSLLPPAWLRTQRDQLKRASPGSTLAFDGAAPALAAGWWSLVALLPLIAAMLRPAISVHAIWIGLTLGLVLALISPVWELPSLCVLLVYLAAAIRYAGPADWRFAGDSRAWRDGLVLLALLMAPALVLFLWSSPTRVLSSADALYPLWALLQQGLLCCVLWPLSGRISADPGWRVGLCAVLFALAHLPNFELSVLTLLLATVTLAHFRRHQALLPVALLHGIAGLAYLQLLPGVVLYSGRVGAHYWS